MSDQLDFQLSMLLCIYDVDRDYKIWHYHLEKVRLEIKDKLYQ